MRVGRGGEINSLWVRGQKNRETVTTSLCLMFMVLHVVALAMVTPVWSKGQQSSSEHSRVLTT